jgi:hypothetical protein
MVTYQGVTYFGGGQLAEWQFVKATPIVLPPIAAGFSVTQSVEFEMNLNVPGVPSHSGPTGAPAIGTFFFAPAPGFPADWDLVGGSYVVDTVLEPGPWLLVLTAGGLAWLAYRRPS